MNTKIFQGVVTAQTSIVHGSGEKTGITSLLRREKIIGPDYRVEEVPVISGNAMRGILRDVGMYDMLRRLGYGVNEDGTVKGLPLSAFYALFSGGALVSSSAEGIDVDKMRKLRELIPLIGVFGCAVGNTIMNGKVKVGKLIPICRETVHLLPERFRIEQAPSIYELCQVEMYTRRDDEKNEKVRMLIDPVQRALLADGSKGKQELTNSSVAQQMMYRQETFAAGTRFFWDIVIEDATDIEFSAFVQTLLAFSKAPYIGGRSAVGHGKVSIKFDGWIEVDSRAHLEGKEIDLPLLAKYQQHLEEHREEIMEALNTEFA